MFRPTFVPAPKDLRVLQSGVDRSLLKVATAVTSRERIFVSDALGTAVVEDLLSPLALAGHSVINANKLKRNQRGYDFIVDDSLRIQVKTGSFVESFGWVHKVDGSGADLEYDFLIGVDLGVLLEGNLGRLKDAGLPRKQLPDLYLVPGEVVRSWLARKLHVNKRGNHIYIYKRSLNPNTKEARGQTHELRTFLNNFGELEKALGPLTDNNQRNVAPESEH